MVNVSLNADSDILTSPSVKRIFIEYNFLGTNETPSIDVRKLRPKSTAPNTEPISVAVNSCKVFRIDVAPNGPDRRAAYSRLIKLLRHQEKNIKFLVVSEQSKRQRLSEGSDEMALGLLHLGRIVAEAPAASRSQVVQVPIMSKKHPYNSVGHLEVSVEGIAFMQQLTDGQGYA